MASLMKGNKWHERRDAVDRRGNPIVKYPVMVETKHDEVRVHVLVEKSKISTHPSVADEYVVKYLSYAGKPLANLERFSDDFIRLANTTGQYEFDMGFEVNGNYNDSFRWVRSTRGLPEELEDAPVRWLIYGLPGLGGTLASQWAHRLAVAYKTIGRSIRVNVPMYVWAHSADDVERIFSSYRNRGYEGAMVKQPEHLYERSRTDGWLKMKPEDDEDGIIVALHEAIAGVDQPELGIRAGDRLGRTGSITIRMPDGSEATPHGISHELGRDMHNNPEKYIGHWAEFKFMERDRQGGYRHPVFHRLREAK